MLSRFTFKGTPGTIDQKGVVIWAGIEFRKAEAWPEIRQAIEEQTDVKFQGEGK